MLPMAPVYDKPVRLLMKDMVSDLVITPGQTITRDTVRDWFESHYPKVKDGTIQAHLLRMSTNASSRVHYGAKPDDDLFFQVDKGTFRLYQPESDPTPIYKDPVDVQPGENEPDISNSQGSPEFPYEKDLQNYLARNLDLIEPGLTLYKEDDINGLEFPAGGRFIDILAVDQNGGYVVIELKVSKGYDRVVGQLLRYMQWIKQHQAEQGQTVRGVIVARSISKDLILACSAVSSIQLFEYRLSVDLRSVSINTSL